MKPTVPLVDIDAEARAELDRVGAPVSNLYRILGNNPSLLRAWLDFAWTLRGAAVTPRRLRELMILRCAALAASDYQWKDHEVMARAAGVADVQIEAVRDWEASSLFDDEERLVLRFTDELVGGHAGDDVLEAMQERFGPQELVELVLTVSFYVMVPRVLDALRVPLSDA